MAFFFHRKDDNIYDIAHLYSFAGVLQPTIADLRDMHQSILMHADVHKNAKVNDISYGDEKDIILHCSVSTIDAKAVILANLEVLLGVSTVDASGKQMPSTQMRPIINEVLYPLLCDAERVEGSVELVIYDTKDKGLQLYRDADAMDVCFGGVISAKKEIDALKKITINGEEIDVSKSTNLRKALTDCTGVQTDAKKPDTSNWIGRQWNGLKDDFYNNFIKDDNKSNFTNVSRQKYSNTMRNSS